MKILNQIQNHYKVHTDSKRANSDLKKSRKFTASVRFIIFLNKRFSYSFFKKPENFCITRDRAGWCGSVLLASLSLRL